jgi:PAS domain S-box-containing protein
VENARDYAIFSLDLNRRITTWNSGAQAILGYTEEEAIGQSGDIIFHRGGLRLLRGDEGSERRDSRWARCGRAVARAEGWQPLLGQRRDDGDAQRARRSRRLCEDLPRPDRSP